MPMTFFLRLLALFLMLAGGGARAIEPGEVRQYGDVFAISARALAANRVEVRWDIAEDYFLYNNRFLAFSTTTPGVELGAPDVPPGELTYDELLGEEVVKFRDRLAVAVPLSVVPPGTRQVSLDVRSQGCLEKVLCYPPTTQTVLVSLPASVDIATIPAPRAQTETLASAPVRPRVNPTDPAAASPQPLASDAASNSLRPSAQSSALDELLGNVPAGPGAGDAALPPEQAFRYEAIALDEGTALVRFTAEPGYYLYVDHFAFRVVAESGAAASSSAAPLAEAITGSQVAGGVSVDAVELPEGTIKDDPEFGPVPVIFGQAEIPVRFARPAGPAVTVTLEADWQGCRDGDICYPPQTGRILVELPAAAVALQGSGGVGGAGTGAGLQRSGSAAEGAGASGEPASEPFGSSSTAPVSEQGRLATLLLENPAGAMVAFFLAGLLLAFTPCVFPMVPILSGIIAGEGDRITTARALTLSLVYVLAMALAYTVAGVLAGLFGKNLQAVFQHPAIITAVVVVFVLLALSMFGFYELRLPSRWQTRITQASNRMKGGRLGGVAVMGLLSALIVGPCVAPPLAAALIVIGESGSPVLGGAALFALSLGMGAPLVAFGASAGRLLPKAGAWMNTVQAVFGVGLLALAIWMLERIVPGVLVMVLWGLLAVGCGVYLGALERIPEGAGGWARLWKALGVSLLLFGAIQFVGAASGGDYWLKPLGHFSGGGQAQEHVAFRRVKSVEDLDNAVAQANAQGRPAVFDFYADWCVECIRMERNTFPEPEVQALLTEMTPLQADVTAHDDVDQALMRRHGVIGPPAILFFDRYGNELEDYRLVGYFEPTEFAAHLRQVLAAW